MPRAFEQPATIALPPSPDSPGAALEGLYVPVPDPLAAAVVAPPHPLLGGSMESPVVGEVAWACQKAEVASLRFNWRGVGASGGTPSADLGLADVDFRAALDFLAESVPVPRVACGYSFGSLAAVRAAQSAPGIQRLILIAPPTQGLDAQAIRAFPGRVLLVAGEDDEWVDTAILVEIARQSAAAHVEVIPRCDHFFMRGLDELGRRISRWWSGERD